MAFHKKNKYYLYLYEKKRVERDSLFSYAHSTRTDQMKREAASPVSLLFIAIYIKINKIK